jgi:hypothetical protein
MTIARCGAKASDAFWEDHRCGLKKGHEDLPLGDPDKSRLHQCCAVYWEKKPGQKQRRIVQPCGFSWR